MNLLQTGASWLGDQLKSATGIDVIYARGANELSLTGVVAQQVYEIDDQHAGLLTSVVIDDWTFKAADLGLTPQKGDTITSALGTFEVLPIANQPCFQQLDTSGILLTVHSKRIA